MFSGSLVALITPFKGGKVDEKGFENFVKWQIEEGTDGLVPCGTTGESPTLDYDEHKRVIDICVQTAKGTGVPVIAGTGSNSTAEAIELTRHAKKVGAEAAMLVVRTTTSRPRKASTSTSRPWPKRSISRSCSTTCRHAPAATCRSRR